MVQLQSLPTEILTHILSFLADPDEYNSLRVSGEDKYKEDPVDDDYSHLQDTESMKELCRLCLVSQKLRELAQPLLYRNFHDDFVDHDQTGMISFTRSIYQRHGLGERVKEVSIEPFSPISLSSRQHISPDDIKLFGQVIRGLELGDREASWMSAMERADPGVLLALMLNRTPNLSQLTVSAHFVSMEPLNDLFIRNTSFLHNLHYIWVECEPELPGYDISPYQHIIGIPNLQLVNFQRAVLVNQTFPSSWGPGTLGVGELTFTFSHIDATNLKKFTQAYKKIASFTFTNFSYDLGELPPSSPATASSRQFDAGEAHAALLLHKESLENLCLEFWREPWIITSIEAYQDYLSRCVKVGSFSDFSVLESISIQHALLPIHPEFPPCLKQLVITDCNSSIREMVGNIAADCKMGLYPNLTSINVQAIDVTRPIKLPGQRIPPGQSPHQCFLSLQALFKGTKVDFEISPYQVGGLDDDAVVEEPLFDEDMDSEYEDYPDLTNFPEVELYDPENPFDHLLGRYLRMHRPPSNAP